MQDKAVKPINRPTNQRHSASTTGVIYAKFKRNPIPHRIEVTEDHKYSGWKFPNYSSSNHRKIHKTEKILLLRGRRYFAHGYVRPMCSGNYYTTWKAERTIDSFIPYTNYVVVRYHSSINPRKLLRKLQQKSIILDHAVGLLRCSTGQFLEKKSWENIRVDEKMQVEEYMLVYDRNDNLEMQLDQFVGKTVDAISADLRLEAGIHKSRYDVEDWWIVTLGRLLRLSSLSHLGPPPLYTDEMKWDSDRIGIKSDIASMSIQPSSWSLADREKSAEQANIFKAEGKRFKVPPRPTTKFSEITWLGFWSAIVFLSFWAAFISVLIFVPLYILVPWIDGAEKEV